MRKKPSLGRTEVLDKNIMIRKCAEDVFRVEAKAISDLVSRLDHRFGDAIDLLYGCQGKVVVTGMGKSGLIGRKVEATLASTGTPAFFLHPAEAVHGDLGIVSRGDIVIAISNSGETEELIKILPTFKRLGVPIICLTGKLKSTLAKNSEIVLDVGVKEEAGNLGIIPTASTTAALAMGDAIAVALFEKRGLKEEDFQYFHPGGVLGKQLLIRVVDVMHTGRDIPIVSEDTPMKETVAEMTSKRLGITTVQNREGRLGGVITDGDLRRLLQRESDLLSLKASEVMIRNPKVISSDILGAKAVQIMERYSITSLVVVDDDSRIIGIVHLHDLLKIGVI
jgi:arabinose-5-phosphate isomerase